MKKSYYVYLTRECNLRCKYCFQNRNYGHLTTEIAQQIEQFILQDSQDCQYADIIFFGGEPLINIPLLKWFVKRFSNQRDKFNLSFTTNGTLFTEELLLYFLKNRVYFALSTDGLKETHDKNRIFENGKGSFDKIPFELVAKHFPNTQIISVVDPSNVRDLAKNTWFFVNLGFHNIAHNFDYYQEWTDKDIEILKENLNEINKIYYKKPVSFHHIMWAEGNIQASYSDVEQTLCGLTQFMCATDINGDIYPCQEYVLAKEKYIIGHVSTGINETKREYGLKCKKYLKKPKTADCKNCIFQFKCTGGCGPHSLACFKDRFIVPEGHCKIMQAIIPIGLKALVVKKTLPLQHTNTDKKLDTVIHMLNNVDLIRLEKV